MKDTRDEMPKLAAVQVDTDDDLGTMWGDCGMIYYWIRRQDLEQQTFEDTWLVLQCS